MAIRKYGNEPAKTEVRVEDNDPETLDAVVKRAANDEAFGEKRERPRPKDFGQDS